MTKQDLIKQEWEKVLPEGVNQNKFSIFAKQLRSQYTR